MDAIAPYGMSYVNAFHALRLCARTLEKYRDNPKQREIQEEAVSTPEKVAAFIENNGPFITEAGGRELYVSFKDFPRLIVASYDEINGGKGAAQKALDLYAKTPSYERFDSFDCYRYPQPKARL